ncbi:unnamed protein product [Lymnaea stagnalis]|uniref:Uncharacterized protein n=1 Tax=Lymnaea stagnalis TaxID=6523 RepID=A0AAV2I413_LYMST
MLSVVDHWSTCFTSLSKYSFHIFSHPTMSPVLKLSVVCLVLAVAALMTHTSEANFVGDCWDTWSRCSSWSSFLTGKAWSSCQERCRQLGYRSGNCVLSSSNCPIARKAQQCKCSR